MAVPFRLSTKVTPAGKVPVSLIVGVGLPVAITVKVFGWRGVKVVLSGLVIAGASFTVRVNEWVASGRTPLAALIVNV